jgi:lipopolysaccharide biosynthesis regulator YciM
MMQAGGAMPAAMPVANFDSLLNITKKKLSPEVVAMIAAQEKLLQSGDQSISAGAYDSLGRLWQQNKYLGIAAHYYAENGKLENSEKKLNFAAHLYSEELQTEKSPDVRQWLAEGAIDCYTKALVMNPANDSARFELANIYINEAGQTVAGVQQLLRIVQDDPSTLPANLVLGSMAIESGQYDKAIDRGELILKYHKDNWQARLFMAEAYKQLGKKGKAIEMLDEAMRYNKDPDFAKDVAAYKATL